MKFTHILSCFFSVFVPAESYQKPLVYLVADHNHLSQDTIALNEKLLALCSNNQIAAGFEFMHRFSSAERNLCFGIEDYISRLIHEVFDAHLALVSMCQTRRSDDVMLQRIDRVNARFRDESKTVKAFKRIMKIFKESKYYHKDWINPETSLHLDPIATIKFYESFLLFVLEADRKKFDRVGVVPEQIEAYFNKPTFELFNRFIEKISIGRRNKEMVENTLSLLSKKTDQKLPFYIKVGSNHAVGVRRGLENNGCRVLELTVFDALNALEREDL